MRMRYAALAATAMLLAAIAATILLTSNAAPQPTSTVQQTAPHSPRDAPATPVTPQPPDRCATATATDCILAVYKGAPDNYAQIQDIPDSLLIQPDEDGRYQIERGQQITVVTAAWLPTGYTHFNLQRRPLQATVSPSSRERLIPPSGTTYTFTVTIDERGANLISFDLTAARPRPLPGQKPELGDIVVTTNFLVHDPALRHARHHRRRGHRRQLRLPQDGRRRVERDRQLWQLAKLGRRAAHPPNRRERGIPRGPLRHGAGRRQLRLPDERPPLRVPLQGD